jgi:hypothetical protein
VRILASGGYVDLEVHKVGVVINRRDRDAAHETLNFGALDQLVVGPDPTDTSTHAAIVSRKHVELLHTNNHGAERDVPRSKTPRS